MNPPSKSAVPCCCTVHTRVTGAPYADIKTSGNVLHYGDNLNVLRQHIVDESTDLIYLDPPINSNATYRV